MVGKVPIKRESLSFLTSLSRKLLTAVSVGTGGRVRYLSCRSSEDNVGWDPKQLLNLQQDPF